MNTRQSQATKDRMKEWTKWNRQIDNKFIENNLLSFVAAFFRAIAIFGRSSLNLTWLLLWRSFSIVSDPVADDLMKFQNRRCKINLNDLHSHCFLLLLFLFFLAFFLSGFVLIYVLAAPTRIEIVFDEINSLDVDNVVTLSLCIALLLIYIFM